MTQSSSRLSPLASGQPATTMRVRSAMDRLPDGKAQRGHPEKNHHPKPPYQPLLRSDNPRNDYRGDSHHHRSLTIQQLFEDFHLKRDAAETSGSEPKKASSSGTTSIASTSIDPPKRRPSALVRLASLIELCDVICFRAVVSLVSEV